MLHAHSTFEGETFGQVVASKTEVHGLLGEAAELSLLKTAALSGQLRERHRPWPSASGFFVLFICDLGNTVILHFSFLYSKCHNCHVQYTVCLRRLTIAGVSVNKLAKNHYIPVAIAAAAWTLRDHTRGRCNIIL